MRVAAETALKAHLKAERVHYDQHSFPDPARFELEIILRGLCICVNPAVKTILQPYLKDDKYGYYAGLAMLRAGHEEHGDRRVQRAGATRSAQTKTHSRATPSPII